MDENEFYREITKRICSSLELTTALQRALVYLKQVVPVDSISLHLYEQHLGAVKTIAIVTASERKVLDKVISLSLEGKASFEKPGTPNVRIVNHPETDPVISKIAEAMRLTNASALVMRLVIEGKRLGSLVLTTRGADRYTEEHARLLALLNEPVAIALSNALQHQEVIWLKDMLTDDNRYLHRELLRISGDEIIGEDFGLKNVMEMVRKVAPLESPVLLLGETGVGKGLIASAVHYLSRRSKGPFIVVNSGAIPETLIDSELFGHEKGAFTGAIEQKRGRFERADHGTIFLDEIGELPPQAQVRMLRVLQEKVIERVGGSRPISVDIRIIAATHRNLEEMIRSNRFRQDLLFRINVFPITVPPLRDRKEDIPSLVHYFIRKKTRELKLNSVPEPAPGAMDRLLAYSWPGNVRELENVIEREMILSREGFLKFDLLSVGQKGAGAVIPSTGAEPLGLEEINISHIRKILRLTHGKVHGPEGAAALLGVNPSTLRSRMKRMGIKYGRSNPAGIS